MLTCEHLQAVANLICDYEQIPWLTVKIKNTRRGHAHGSKGWVGVPAWSLEEGDSYACYYVIHEVCHVVSRQRLHTLAFKAVETRWLESYGMRPVYQYAYPRALVSAADGRTLWSRETSRHCRPRRARAFPREVSLR